MKQRRRPESEWKRTPRPEWRIVSDELWNKVAEQAVTNLLVNLATCGQCGRGSASLVAKLRELKQRRTAIDEENADLRPAPRLATEVIEGRLARMAAVASAERHDRPHGPRPSARRELVFTPAGLGYQFEAPTRIRPVVRWSRRAEGGVEGESRYRNSAGGRVLLGRERRGLRSNSRPGSAKDVEPRRDGVPTGIRADAGCRFAPRPWQFRGSFHAEGDRSAPSSREPDRR